MSRYKRKDQHFNDCLEALSEKPKRRITDVQISLYPSSKEAPFAATRPDQNPQ